MASLHWLDDDIVLLIGRCLANAPTSLSAFAKTSCSIHTLFAAMLAELKCLNCVCRSAVGIASMAQLRSLGTLIFHDQPFAQHELSGLSLVLSTTCTPNLTELCIHGGLMDDNGLVSLLGVLAQGGGKYCLAGAAAKLTMLSITEQRFTRRAVEAIANSIPSFERLRLLELSCINCTYEDLLPLFCKCHEIYDNRQGQLRAAGASKTILVEIANLRKRYRFGPASEYTALRPDFTPYG